jgi:integrase
MPTQALTTDFLNSLPSRSSSVGLMNYFDTETKGFMLEVRASGGATFYFRYRDPGGRIRMNRIGRRDEIALADARAKAHQMKKMVTEGGDPKAENHRFKDIPTFGEFFRERFLPFVKSRKRSWQTDEVLARHHLLPAFEALRLNRVTRADVLAFHQAAHTKGYAPGTCNRMLVLLKFMYNCAIRWEILPATGNPCVGVDPLDDNGARERYLSAPEVQRLFDELDSNRNVQVAQVVRLLLYTGARKREVLDARWEHVDFDRRLLTVPLSKSGKPRHIPLSDAAIELLQGLTRIDDIPWVFFNPKTRKPPVSIFYAWDSIRAKVGLKDVRLHDLRHSFASFLVNSGRSLYEVQRLLGHHDPKVTMRYAHLSPGALIEAANVVGDLVVKARRVGRPVMV